MEMKTFNLADAIAGHPIADNTGRPVRVLATDLMGQYPIVVAIKSVGTEKVIVADADGVILQGHHLVMIPCGAIEGRCVWPGDRLESTSVPGVTFTVTPDMRDFANCKWPREYPRTQMTAGELHSSYYGKERPITPDNQAAIPGFEQIAAAVIKHGIDGAYLYDAKRVNALFTRMMERIGPSARLTLEEMTEHIIGELTK